MEQKAAKVVVRCRDKRIIKGYTFDFSPARDTMHVIDVLDERKVTEVALSEIKAVFYVRTFEGNPSRAKPKDFSEQSLKGVPGVKLKVTFEDGEVMYGTANAYAPGRKGFFITPADKNSNNERVYIVAESTKSVHAWR